jgi:hypothetical protein
MGPFASRQVILLPFPFSDLSARKLRSSSYGVAGPDARPCSA